MTAVARTSVRFAGRSLASALLAVLSVSRTRRTLGRLDDHNLRDIGLTREQAEHEASRPLWDVPNNWRR